MVLGILALGRPRAVRTASRVVDVSPEAVHVVGPTEKAVLGNVLVRAQTLGEELPDVAAIRALLVTYVGPDALRTADRLGRLGRGRGPVDVSRCV